MSRYHAQWFDRDLAVMAWEGEANSEKEVVEIISKYFGYKPFKPTLLQRLCGVSGDELTIDQPQPPLRCTKAPHVYIAGCSDPMMWYSNKIGTTVPIITEASNEWVVRCPDGYSNIVLKQDGVEIKLSLHER